MPGAVKACLLRIKKAVIQQLNLHWVKFKLQDDKGTPMVNVVVKVKLPDGSFEEAVSDDTGLIHIKNLTPGSCSLELSFEGQQAMTTVFLQ